MPIGAGACPAGTSFAGYGLPDLSAAPNHATLPDAKTGLPQTGRLLDPTSQSYKFTADGRVIGQSTGQQLVQLAVKTIVGSSVIANLGMDRSRLQEKGANFAQTVTSVVTDAFAPIVSQGLVTLNSVDVQDYPNIPDRSVVTIKWTDNSTGQEHDTVI